MRGNEGEAGKKTVPGRGGGWGGIIIILSTRRCNRGPQISGQLRGGTSQAGGPGRRAVCRGRARSALRSRRAVRLAAAQRRPPPAAPSPVAKDGAVKEYAKKIF